MLFIVGNLLVLGLLQSSLLAAMAWTLAETKIGCIHI